MGVYNVLTWTAELSVIAWYVGVPLSHGAWCSLLRPDLVDAWHMRQSLAATALLAIARLGLFVYIRLTSKKAPATRCFVFLVFLIQGALGTLAVLQPAVFLRDDRSFVRYRSVSWAHSFVSTLAVLTSVSAIMQLGYILQLNRSRGRLTDDHLMRDVLKERYGGEMAEAKLVFWRSKWSNLVQHIKQRRPADPTFEAMLRLYAQRDEAVDRLARVYDRAPRESEFYLPQLCSFLLTGASAQSSQLCMMLLEKCTMSHVFAHKMLWYLQSYCERVPFLLCAEVVDYVTPAMEKALQKRNNMFTSRRFTLSFWEKAVEAIPDTISIDSLKRNDREYTTLIDFFRRHFGDESSSEYRAARDNFVSSLAAYSIICYLLQIKDRHNGNILLDAEGHIIHIDFGYMLSNNPGNVAFEQAPFKLTSEFVELMGGPRSATFRRFRSLCVRSFLVARKYRHRFTLLIEMTLHGNEKLPCFAGDARGTINRFAARFQPQLDINACEDFVHSLIDASLDNWRTQWYDKYQRWFVGVF
ncbi:hypothetical protein ATCC90586_006925 [Pythium insidiosum]|nr:hypothetical protein ATCC90586_006925 [Pythium insidiosum]